MILECVVVGFVQTNCYILAAKFAQSAVIIDPGDEEPKIRAVLSRHKLRAGLVILTHGHFDHIGSAHKFSVPVYIHNRERDFLNDPNLNLSGFAGISFTLKADVRGVKDKDIISLEGIE
ncbi:MAG: MBL fold metallo-hydrolase, partial [Candidatus Omnitrophica bacterium]|nr:MBL fold metallo-hydrolase [Candidatus Omnitrophota bacterium]